MKKTGSSVPAGTVRTVEHVVVEPCRNDFRLKAALGNSKSGFKLEDKYTHGYSTEQDVAGEADLFGYAVQEDLAKKWFSFNQRGSCADLTKQAQYSDEFVESNMFRPIPTFKCPMSIVSPPLTIPPNAAQTSRFKKLKQSSCATLSQNEYLEAATSSIDVYDRFVRKLTRSGNSELKFNTAESNRRAYL